MASASTMESTGMSVTSKDRLRLVQSVVEEPYLHDRLVTLIVFRLSHRRRGRIQPGKQVEGLDRRFPFVAFQRRWVPRDHEQGLQPSCGERL
jgi:hypothetical protein